MKVFLLSRIVSFAILGFLTLIIATVFSEDDFGKFVTFLSITSIGYQLNLGFPSELSKRLSLNDCTADFKNYALIYVIMGLGAIPILYATGIFNQLSFSILAVVTMNWISQLCIVKARARKAYTIMSCYYLGYAITFFLAIYFLFRSDLFLSSLVIIAPSLGVIFYAFFADVETGLPIEASSSSNIWRGSLWMFYHNISVILPLNILRFLSADSPFVKSFEVSFTILNGLFFIVCLPVFAKWNDLYRDCIVEKKSVLMGTLNRANLLLFTAASIGGAIVSLFFSRYTGLVFDLNLYSYIFIIFLLRAFHSIDVIKFQGQNVKMLSGFSILYTIMSCVIFYLGSSFSIILPLIVILSVLISFSRNLAFKITLSLEVYFIILIMISFIYYSIPAIPILLPILVFKKYALRKWRDYFIGEKSPKISLAS